MIIKRSELKPHSQYYVAAGYMSDWNPVLNYSDFFNQNIRDKRILVLDLIDSANSDYIMFDESFIFFDSLDEIKELIERLDRKIYSIEIIVLDDGKHYRSSVRIAI
jgi:hypothetical protein